MVFSVSLEVVNSLWVNYTAPVMAVGNATVLLSKSQLIAPPSGVVIDGVANYVTRSIVVKPGSIDTSAVSFVSGAGVAFAGESSAAPLTTPGLYLLNVCLDPSTTGYEQNVKPAVVVQQPPSVNCDRGCASNPCGVRGTCVWANSGYKCVCVNGYTGSTCQTDIDECASQPCPNGATCVDRVAGYTCQTGYGTCAQMTELGSTDFCV